MLAHPGTSNPPNSFVMPGSRRKRLFGILEPTGFTPAGIDVVSRFSFRSEIGIDA